MRRNGRLGGDERGVAAVEFALALPVTLMVIVGVLVWGQYFMLAHTVQQLANDAARATVAGLSPDERRALAAESVAAEVRAVGELRPARLRTAVTEVAPHTVVTVTYDAGDLPLMHASLIPVPAALIERRAAARHGGFP